MKTNNAKLDKATKCDTKTKVKMSKFLVKVQMGFLVRSKL